MGWHSRSVMEEKLKFIRLWQSGEYTMSSLCDYFGVSRVTGYRLIKRFETEGETCLDPRSRRPHRIPHKTLPEIESAIVNLRTKHPNWGARKLIVLLGRTFKSEVIPSETTVNAILSRNGLVKKRGRRPRGVSRLNPDHSSSFCNEIWSVDYKGKFRLGNKRYCHPLTIQDKKSRYLLSCQGHYSETYENVKRAYIAAFRTYGLPQYIHSDNGGPFGHIRSVCRFTRLSYWLIDHGVLPLYSDLASPQQNGKHERMHRDLKAFCTRPVRHTLSKQQILMDEFVREYNDIRPHEGLSMKTPGSVYEASDRSYKGGRVADYEYEANMKVLTVMKSGAIRWGAYHWVYVSTAASRRKVGVEEVGNGIWNMYYRNVLLGYFDIRKLKKKEQYLYLSKPIV